MADQELLQHMKQRWDELKPEQKTKFETQVLVTETNANAFSPIKESVRHELKNEA